MLIPAGRDRAGGAGGHAADSGAGLGELLLPGVGRCQVLPSALADGAGLRSPARGWRAGRWWVPARPAMAGHGFAGFCRSPAGGICTQDGRRCLADAFKAGRSFQRPGAISAAVC